MGNIAWRWRDAHAHTESASSFRPVTMRLVECLPRWWLQVAQTAHVDVALRVCNKPVDKNVKDPRRELKKERRELKEREKDEGRVRKG